MIGELRIIGRQGDTRVEYDTEVEETVREAERVFAERRAQGFAAYTVTPGNPAGGSQVTSFDPQAEVTVLFQPMVGG